MFTRDVRPGWIEVIPDQSSALLKDAAHGHLSLIDCCALGITPMAFRCNEAWTRLFALIEQKFGYCWEWIADAGQPTDEHLAINQPYLARIGVVVLTKVG